MQITIFDTLDKEKVKQWSKNYYDKNQENIKQYQVEYRKNNKDKVTESYKKYYEKNKDKVKEKNKKHRQANKEYLKEYNKTYQKKNKEQIRNQRYLWAYGITLDKYNEILQSQQNKCQICKVDFTNPRQRHLDHCHSTNKVRGILCMQCNSALGFAKDNTQILTNMIKYLEKHG